MSSAAGRDGRDGRPDLSLAEALVCFAAEEMPMPRRRHALSVLIGNKYLPREAGEAAIRRGLAQLILLATATPAVPAAEQLLAIAECVRFGQVVKREAPGIAIRLEPAFASRLPSLGNLMDADDRLNVARACGAAPEVPWLPRWLAHAIADEDTGEKARVELLSALISRCKSMAEVIALLGEAFAALRPATESPGDTVGRRLTRTLAAWRPLLLESELPSGGKLGAALYDFLIVPLGEVGKPETEKVVLDLCEEALLAVHDLVRSRSSLIADAQLYQVVAYCKRLCGGRQWPQALDKSRRRLMADVSEALLLLGKQGQRDQMLLDQLGIIANSTQESRSVASGIAERNPELPESVRDWLLHGRVRQLVQASASAEEYASSNADGVIGMALEQQRRMGSIRGALEKPLVDAVEVYEPSLLHSLRELLDGARSSLALVEQACAMRQVGVYGASGEEVDASAKYFDVAEGAAPRPRMTVRRPAIVRLRPDRTPAEVLIRGQVE